MFSFRLGFVFILLSLFARGDIEVNPVPKKITPATTTRCVIEIKTALLHTILRK